MKPAMYCRKSTESEDRQVLSLDGQQRENFELAQKHGITEFFKIIRESKSAKSPGREGFGDLMKLIEKGKVDTLVCWKLDRLSRNFVDSGLLIHLLQTSVIKRIITSEGVYYPSDSVYNILFTLGQANQYSRDLSANVKRGNKDKMIAGGWPHRACFGYLNDKADKTLVVDKKQASFVVRVFDLYVKERQTLKQIVDTLYQEGLRTRGGNKFGKSQVHKILNNRLYTGYMVDGEGIVRKGTHEVIISVTRFNEAQELLHGKAHPRPKRHLYSAQGFLKCDVCGCRITVDTQKGIQYYYCTNGKFICEQHKDYMTSDDVDVLMSDLFKKLQIDDELIEISSEAYKVKNATDNNCSVVTLETLNNELKLLLQKELKLSDGWSSKTVRDEVYNVQIKEITNKRLELEEQIQNIQKTDGYKVTLEQIKKVFTDCNLASKQYLEVDNQKKKDMLKKFLSNATVKDKKIVSYQFVSLYSVIANAPKNCSIDELLRRTCSEKVRSRPVMLFC